MAYYWLVPGGHILPILGLVLICCACAESVDQSVHNINSAEDDADIEISSLLIEKASAPTVSSIWFASSYVKRPFRGNDSSESAEPGQIVDGILDISASEATSHVLILSCNASCPIQWRFYPAKDELVNTFSALDVMVVEREGVSLLASQNRYLARLTIYSPSNEMTGKYVCESFVNQELDLYKKDEVYVFWEEAYKPSLVNAGKVIHKNLDDTSLSSPDWIDLPCGTSNRQKPAYLFTQSMKSFHLGRNGFYLRMLPNASIVQDQFSGFKLNVAELPGAFESVWICSSAVTLTGAAVENTETVHVILSKFNHANDTKPSGTEMIPKILNNNNDYNSRRAACCRRTCQNCTTNMPTVKLYPVSNAMTGKLFKPLLHRSRADHPSKVTRIPTSCTSHILGNFSCDCSTIEIPDKAKIGFILECSGDLLTPLTQEYYFSVRNNKDNLQVQDYSEIETQNSNSIMEILALDIAGHDSIRFLLGGMYSMYNESTWYQNSHARFHDVRTWMYTDSKNGSYSNSTKITRILGDYIPNGALSNEICTEGEHRCFFCEISRFHFAMGPHWTIDWVNGTSTVDIRHSAELDDVDSLLGGPVPPRIITTFCPVMVSRIKAVSCHAPYLGSSNWKTLSVKAPKILPTEIPTVHGIFGGEGYTGEATELQCNISSKAPVKVQWYAGDKIVQESIEPTGSCLVGNCKMVVSTLKIRSADNTNSSYYTCTATNFKGTDSKTAFHVPREIVRPFIIGHDEMLEFYVGDVNRTLSCTVSGEPRPNRIYWLKYLYPFILHDELFNDSDNATYSSTSIYAIPEIGLNSAGLYKCIASNRLQDQAALKIIYVNVSKSPVTRNIIISSVGFILIIGIIFCVLLRKYKRENTDLIKFEKQFRLGIQYDSNSKVEDGHIRPLSLPYIEDFEIDRAEWKLEQCIGGGEFGEVWWGTLRRFQSMQVIERVAIKFLKPDGQQIPLLKVLCSELKMMMRIKQLGSDPNIVNFIGATTKNFQKMEVYLIMELCCLGSLKSYITTHRNNLLVTQDSETIVKPDVAKWSSDIASGMLFLGKHKIVHIDLAARNVFLTSDKVAKVGDYGLSRNLYDKGFYKQKHPFDRNSWTALEGLRDDIYSVQSDVWSYGVTIWELFSMGSDPAYSQMDTVAALESGERLEKPPFATDETYQLLRSCWEAVPDSRPNFSTVLNYFKILEAELDIRIDEISRVAINVEPTTPNPEIKINSAIAPEEVNGTLNPAPKENAGTSVNQTTAPLALPIAETNSRFTERKLNPYESNAQVPVPPPVQTLNPEDAALEARHYLQSVVEAEDLPKIDHKPVVTILISDPKDQSMQKIVDDPPGRAAHYQSSLFLNAPESWLVH